LGDNLETGNKYAERKQVSIFKERQFLCVSGY